MGDGAPLGNFYYGMPLSGDLECPTSFLIGRIFWGVARLSSFMSSLIMSKKRGVEVPLAFDLFFKLELLMSFVVAREGLGSLGFDGKVPFSA